MTIPQAFGTMAGRQKTYSVQLTLDEKKLLQQQANARKTGQSKVKRAKIILTTAENSDWTDDQIAQNIGCSQALVRKWRKRWCQTRSLEQAPRPGRPRIFEAIIRAKVTAIACSKPTDFDLPLARWSCSDIAAHLVPLGIVVSIATSTVWRWLKSERIKPWRVHAWMHRIDDNFVAKATPVLKLYAQAKFLIKAGFWVVCVDEKTSIQAREGLHPNKGAGAKQPVHFAARYARIGATHLFAALSVADGLIYGCCRPTKTFLDFQAFLARGIDTRSHLSGCTPYLFNPRQRLYPCPKTITGLVESEAKRGRLGFYGGSGLATKICLMVRSN